MTLLACFARAILGSNRCMLCIVALRIRGGMVLLLPPAFARNLSPNPSVPNFLSIFNLMLCSSTPYRFCVIGGHYSFQEIGLVLRQSDAASDLGRPDKQSPPVSKKMMHLSRHGKYNPLRAITFLVANTLSIHT